jgi:inhibitor of KinA
MDILPLGDTALIIRLGNHIAPEIHRRVMAAVARVEAAAIPGIIDIVPAYASITIHYDPLLVASSDTASPYDHLRNHLLQLLDQLDEAAATSGRLVEIPVCYGCEYGPDLSDVARHAGITEREVIALHSGATYLVYMVGFLPGFPYLGELPGKLAMPRRQAPRLMVPAGSVGIGGEQTGVYPLDSPGGWQIIGRTPISLFLPENKPPVLLQPGDRVRFIEISSEEYNAVKVST